MESDNGPKMWQVFFLLAVVFSLLFKIRNFSIFVYFLFPFPSSCSTEVCLFTSLGLRTDLGCVSVHDLLTCLFVFQPKCHKFT